ncbi:MAG TPA: hypothetical protein VGU65_03340 [Frateuria sp.]|uniref:hypothetical protein n=1 Tax=Frateuria sp. TaxID=2211372 RepID=UPI002DE5C16A|nr:hypothetical protein [Frateuria sp.]
MHKPADHPAVSPCLLVADARGMPGFLAASFGAQELYRKTREVGSVMRAEVRIEDSLVMIGERTGLAASLCGSTHGYVPDADTCYTSGLAAGAESVSPPTDQPYGDRTADLRDAEGNLWWIGTHLGA